MAEPSKNRSWILALLAAVAFPTVVLHTTCIAVMGPGTWGSGVEELLPELATPTRMALDYASEFEASGRAASGRSPHGDAVEVGQLRGRLRWSHRLGDKTLFLTEEPERGVAVQHLYAAVPGGVRELSLPRGHIVVRPHWVADGLVYERWNPWAIPPLAKLQRYFRSWADRTLRPEAALYWSGDGGATWSYAMPGHTLSVSPDGRFVAFLRSGALLATYYSLHVWQIGSAKAYAVVSLREHAGEGTKSFSMEWSGDSGALRIHGRSDGFERRDSQDPGPGKDTSLDLLYMPADRLLYDLHSGPA